MIRREVHEANRRSWNAATRVHNQRKRDQAAFLRGGGSTLFPEEVELLGDLRGKRLVHLQCNAGQDTLSVARRGAEVVGVDISDEAIAFARALSAESGIPATFERADVYDWLATTPGTFDVAFSSYGAVQWLTDLPAWGEGLARVLRPGGRFVLVEFHPFTNLLTDAGDLGGAYFGGEPVPGGGVPDYIGAGLAPSGYVAPPEPWTNPHPDAGMSWTMADTVQALLDAGLRLTALREWPYANGCKLVANLVDAGGHRYVSPPELPRFPLMWGVVATR